MKDAYKKAIEILGVNANKQLVWIAQNHPTVFVNAYNRTSPERMEEVYQLLREGKTIAALKRRKELMGGSLTEAKAFIDSIRDIYCKK